ncbi:MAG: hypothetical protein AAFW75_28670 [Cyanobacteria bacterium J06636_16]
MVATVPNDSEPISDIVVDKQAVYRDRYPGPEDVYLIIEIANSRPECDLEIKRPTYAQAGFRVLGVST